MSSSPVFCCFLLFGGKGKSCKDPSSTFCFCGGGCCCCFLLTKVHLVISHYPGAVFDYPKIRKKGDIFYD
jgi:hypothetical protein